MIIFVKTFAKIRYFDFRRINILGIIEVFWGFSKLFDEFLKTF